MVINKYPICHLSSVHRAFDDRILYKECFSLAEFGYNVVLIAGHHTDEMVNKVKIKGIRSINNRLLRIFIKPIILFFYVLQQKTGFIHLHDPELLPIGIALKLLGKKVIYDIHELVYHSIDDKRYLKIKLVKCIIKQIYLILERLCIGLFDSIILAEDGYRDYYYMHYRKFANKFTLIRNYPVLDFIYPIRPNPRSEHDSFVLIYAGLLAKTRSIHIIIESLIYCRAPVELWLLGKWENESYFQQCSELPNWKQVKYFGMLKPEEVYGYMKSADIGIALLLPIKNYLTSLPVKSFEYIACGIPVIISDFPYYHEVFSDNVRYSDPLNPESIANNINCLIEQKHADRCQLVQKSLSVIRERNWEREKERLKMLYDNLCG